MRARLNILGFALFAGITALALPGAAAAEYYVPPGNSAANQYTESLPGAGGNTGGKHKQASPAQTLGAGNAKRLEEQGSSGKAAAELAAETAPTQLDTTSSSATTGTGSDQSSGGGSGAKGSGGPSPGGAPVVHSGVKHESAPAPQPQGSSGLGSVLGEATGASDGSLGLWLPLAILLTLAGAIAYRVRHRGGQAA